MNDNVTPSLQPFLAPIPFEEIGKTRQRATELDRDRAAIELAAYVIGILKFDASDICGHREELLRRANKVRISQGNGAVLFVTETAGRIRAAAAEPSLSKAAFEGVEAELARQMAEPKAPVAFDGDFMGAP